MVQGLATVMFDGIRLASRIEILNPKCKTDTVWWCGLYIRDNMLNYLQNWKEIYFDLKVGNSCYIRDSQMKTRHMQKICKLLIISKAITITINTFIQLWDKTVSAFMKKCLQLPTEQWLYFFVRSKSTNAHDID